MYSIQLLRFDDHGEGRTVIVSSHDALTAAHTVAQYLEETPEYAERFFETITRHPAAIEFVTMQEGVRGYWLIRVASDNYVKRFPHNA